MQRLSVTSRRTFLRQSALAAPLILVAPGCLVVTASTRNRRTSGRTADLVIIGGGLGGCAAALAATRAGLRVIMTEETEWIGGQLTAQAVPPDENTWIETIGGTRSYRAMRTAVRDHYRTQTPLTARAKANARLNPGNGWVSRLCAEPRVYLQVLESMLAPSVASGQLTILRRHRAVRADVHGAEVRRVEVQDLDTGHTLHLEAPFFVDATELGDLLPLTGTECVTGAEARTTTGEPDAAPEEQPDNQQAFTICFAMDYRPGEDHTIDRPAEYDTWRSVRLRDGSNAPYPLLGFEDADSARIGFDPDKRTGFWSYRRIIDRDLFIPGTHPSDVTIVNWGQNDYSFGALTGDLAEAAHHIAQAEQLSLSLLYWLQTEAPRPNGAIGWKGLRLRPDVMGTTNGLAKAPYIRESRRIAAMFTVLQQHVSADVRRAAQTSAASPLRAERFADSVGIGHYAMDLHLTTRGTRGHYGATLPFQIPLGALIPRRMRNLLPACKNIGVTHLTNGCYRLHPIEWNIGESVGHLVAYCLAHRAVPVAVRETPTRLADYQRQLSADGIPLAWPDDLPERG